MDINAAFPGSYLKAADLQGRTVTVEIDRVEMEEFGGEPKPVLYFRGKDRGLVLNKTNSMSIAEVHGNETNDWSGARVQIYPDRCSFQGRMVDCIRLRPVQSGGQNPLAQGRTQQPPQQTGYPDAPNSTGGQTGSGLDPADDDIPF